jgi:hypothetical protein
LIKTKHRTADELVERFDGLMKAWMSSLIPSYDRRKIDSLKAHYSHLKKTRDIGSYSKRLSKETIKAFAEERKRPHIPTKKEQRILSVEADLTYIDNGCLIGSYSPDERAKLPPMNDDSDCVRCICGITEEDGEMVQCDQCKFWMHADCVR